MPLTFNLLKASMGLFAFSFLLSIILGDSFGGPQVVMGIFASSAPLFVSYMADRTRVQSDADKSEIQTLKANIQSLEADISRINLALKLRN